MNVKNRIIELCDQRGISINRLAELSEITQSTLNSIMNNNDPNPQYKTIEKICKGLNITLSDFFVDNQIKQLVSDDLFPILLDIIKKMDLPLEAKDKVLNKLDSLSEGQKQKLLPHLVNSIRVAEDQVHYKVDGSLTDVIDKYKNLPEDHRKALALIIDSLHRSH